MLNFQTYRLAGVSMVIATVLCSSTMAADKTVSDAAWMRSEAERLLEGCRVEGKGGVQIFTPDGIGHYKALWTRDAAYMVEFAGDLMDADEIKAAILYLLNGQRADGCMPDRVNAAGVSIFSPGGEKRPMADHALDNGPFVAKLVYAYVKQTGDLAFFRQVEPAVRRGLDHTRRAKNGLVYNPPKNPECVYGFTDIVTKTGNLLFCSLLYFDACTKMETLSRKADCGEPEVYKQRASLIRKNINVLWNDQAGMFWAADVDCKQIDIWGSTYAVEVGCVTPKQKNLVAKYMVDHYKEVVQRGQVRHLPAGEYWQRLFANHDHTEDTYQNGAYWSTPLAWIVPVIKSRNPKLAQRMIDDTIADFRSNGVYECVNGEYTKVENFVVSALSVYHLVK